MIVLTQYKSIIIQYNNQKVVGSFPANVVCFTVDRWNSWGKLSTVASCHSFFRAVGSWCQRWRTRIWHG